MLIKICLTVVIIVCIVMLLRFLTNIFTKDAPERESFRSTATLIKTEEIASLSVSEFVYNGIAQVKNGSGEIIYNILYNSTLKVSVDVDAINYVVDDAQKTVTFTFSEFTYEVPVIDPDSLRFIPNQSVEVKEAIALCRDDALSEASESEKLILLAQDNLKSILEAWYSPLFDGYEFHYIFEMEKGGEVE